ncbi:uncharacterized protein [Linepithema humile]|uniref:uncharacterized protein n=1 Tax=Linepithema humile TaxID=83485 RepID=UPI00351F2869
MGKTSHTSRKRRRSPSADRIAGLEEKMSHLIDILSQSEVMAPRRLSPQRSVLSASPQTSQGSRIHSRSDSEVGLEAPLVPADPSVVSDADEDDFPPPGPEQGLLQASSLPDISVSGEVTAVSLAKQLFGERDIEKVSFWDEIVTQTWQDLTRSGLVTDQRDQLFKKYSPPDAAAFLKAPALNQECRVALKGNSVIKRDDFACKNQDQLGKALCALGEAISDFLCPATQSSLTSEARLAVAKVNDGARILADLFHQLSKSRRAQIMPALNLAAKDTANAIPSDKLLFGTSFGDQIKKVAAMQKSSKEIIRVPVQISRQRQYVQLHLVREMPEPLRPARGRHPRGQGRTQIAVRDYLASIDLEDAYLLVPVHQNDRKFLRFRFLGHLYQFRVLPFGLASAPYIFTKILRPVAYFLRVKGFSSVIYLDDFLFIAPSHNQCRKNIKATRQLLLSLGFLINERKSVSTPTSSCRFLGFIFNTSSFTVSIPPDRREKLFQRSLDILARSSCKIRYLASFIGSLISVCPAVQYGMLHTKILERIKFLALTSTEGDFEAQMSLPSSIREDLHWWKNIFADKSQENPIRSGLFDLEIFSDAFLTGWGAVCSKGRSHGFWSPEEKHFHINYLELLAVFHALRCFAAHLSNSSVLLRVDNSTALSYINRMGSIRFPLLSNLAREIWMWCADRNIFIYAAYIPSAQNCEADAESRVVSEGTEWTLDHRYFSIINHRFGQFDIDLFASSINNKCVRFVSWLPDPLAEAVDAFSLHWGSFYFYAFPPFILILKVLRKIISDEAEGVVVVPWWPVQPWFPLFNRIIVSRPICFNPNINMLSSPFRKFHPAWDRITLIAARLSGKPLSTGELHPKQ